LLLQLLLDQSAIANISWEDLVHDRLDVAIEDDLCDGDVVKPDVGVAAGAWNGTTIITPIEVGPNARPAESVHALCDGVSILEVSQTQLANEELIQLRHRYPHDFIF
jgi:hypothetical protein